MHIEGGVPLRERSHLSLLNQIHLFFINNDHAFPSHLPTPSQLDQLWDFLETEECIGLDRDVVISKPLILIFRNINTRKSIETSVGCRKVSDVSRDSLKRQSKACSLHLSNLNHKPMPLRNCTHQRRGPRASTPTSTIPSPSQIETPNIPNPHRYRLPLFQPRLQQRAESHTPCPRNRCSLFEGHFIR